MKTCKKCGDEKPLNLYSRKLDTRDKLQPLCKECSKVNHSKWQKLNPEKMSVHSAAWRKSNPDKVSAYTSAWYKTNVEHVSHMNAAWKKANPDKVKAQRHRRRSRKTGAGGSYTQAEVNTLVVLCNWVCGYCGERSYQHLDHVVPVASGGSSSIDNMLPTCSGCNLSKGKKEVLVWLASKGPAWTERYLALAKLRSNLIFSSEGLKDGEGR